MKDMHTLTKLQGSLIKVMSKYKDSFSQPVKEIVFFEFKCTYNHDNWITIEYKSGLTSDLKYYGTTIYEEGKSIDLFRDLFKAAFTELKGYLNITSSIELEGCTAGMDDSILEYVFIDFSEPSISTSFFKEL